MKPGEIDLNENYDAEKVKVQKQKLADFILLKTLHADAVIVQKGGQTSLNIGVLSSISKNEIPDISVKPSDPATQRPEWMDEADAAIIGKEVKNAKQTKKAVRRKKLP